MYRPQRFKFFDEENPEYALIDSLTEEMFVVISPKILWWTFKDEETKAAMSELELLYGETMSSKKFLGPIEVFGHLETDPVITELQRMGIEQIESIKLSVNRNTFANLIGFEPKAGDIFLVKYPKDNRQTFYTVSTVDPSDLYNMRYTNYIINAEQTNMNDVDQEIIDYNQNF